MLQACCASFSLRCLEQGILLPLLLPGFSLRYETTIPRQVGLAGSSALLLSCFSVLCDYYNLDPETDLNLTEHTLPQFILNIEQRELGISAGLQDRVVQVWNTCVQMDFNEAYMKVCSLFFLSFVQTIERKRKEESKKVHDEIIEILQSNHGKDVKDLMNKYEIDKSEVNLNKRVFYEM